MLSPPQSTNCLLRNLPAAEIDELRPYLETVDLVRGSVLIEAGTSLTHVYLPHSGIISLVVSLSEGQTVEVAMVGHDSAFGGSAVLDGRTSLTDAIVLVPGTASVIEVATLRRFANRNQEFRAVLMRHEQAVFAQALQTAACNASHSVDARLSRWLLRARDLTGDVLPMTQEFLAQMIGVQRNAVSIVANAARRHPSLQPRAHRNHGFERAEKKILRVLPNGPEAKRPIAEPA